MKKSSYILVTILFSLIGSGGLLLSQNNQVLNSYNYLKTKQLDKAKIASDLAADNESTKGKAKTWMYRGRVYLAIYSDTGVFRKLDPEAQEKSLYSFIKCLEIDAKDNFYKDSVQGQIVQTAAATNRKAVVWAQMKEFDKAIRCYNLVDSALKYDFLSGMKRNNMTKDKILYNKFEMYKYAGNKEKTAEFANKLIEMKYKEPKIYSDMVQLSLIDKDTAKALSYIEKGRALFEDNSDLITMELNIYLAQKKTDVLKKKLQDAIAVTPDNEILHLVLANLYKSTNQMGEAEKEYLKAIEVKADYEPANYNLGVLYYSMGKDFNDKLNALPAKDPKIKEYETKKDENFKKAVVYFEKSYEVTKDAKTKQLLRQLYLRLGDTAKADTYK